MKIGIVGVGLVGKAVACGLFEKGHEIYVYDKDPTHLGKYGDTIHLTHPSKEYVMTYSSKENMMAVCQVIFICVDTPQRENGGCDLTNVYDVFNSLHRAWGEISRSEEGLRITQKQPIIAIKSTVIPGTLDTLKAAYPWCCSNPEFLRQDHALKDFLNPDRIIIGADKPEVIETMLNLYEDFNCEYIWSCKPREAELIKYISNAFLVTKVAFANEIASISELLGVDPRIIYSGLSGDKRINESHLDPTKGKIPADSACLPKDMLALIQQLDMSDYDTNFLKTAYAKAVRGIYLDFKLEVVQ